MIHVKGIIIVLNEPDVSQRVVCYPAAGLRHGQLPLPLYLIKMDVTESGKPKETELVCGAVDAVYLVGNQVHMEGRIDPDTGAGGKIANWFGSVPSIAVAPQLDDITMALIPLESLDIHGAPPELLSWKIRGVALVHDDYAPWPQARLWPVVK